jgi:ribosomal protein S12 methylthiotransferase accessory factor
MTYRPQFKRHFRTTLLPSEGVVLQSEHGHALLRGPVYSLLAPLLDGQHTFDEIVASLDGHVSAVETQYALELLHRRGYLADAVPSVPQAQAAFWDVLSVDPREATSRLHATPVSVMTFADIPQEPFCTLLAALGVPVSDDGACTVVLTDDYLHEKLHSFNAAALRHEHSWLLVKPVGTELWVGPLFTPGKTGCWACLAHRLQGSRKIDSYLQEKTNTPPGPALAIAALPSTLTTALSIAATETARWVASGRHEGLEGRIVTLNLLSLEKQTHVLVQRPQCPHCGDPHAVAVSQSTPLVLESRKKVFVSDGGHRGFVPEETFATLAHHISPMTGIVGTLRPLAPWVGDKSLTPSFVATQNFVHTPQEDSLNLDALSTSLRSGAGGKGKHPTQAKVSALCEAIEHYSGTFQGDEFRLRARFTDISDAAVHPNACMLYSTQQFELREQWNARASRSTWVPEPFDTEKEVEWSLAWSLTANEPRYLPTAYCYYGYSRQHKTWFARADSNGCAAGRSKEEAILQGILEGVERDSISLWWYNRLSKPAVDLSSFDDPYFQELQEYYTSLHRNLWVLDITSDLAIPTFAALSRRTDAAVEDITLGFGTHFDARLAIQRALTEMNQWLPVVCSGSAEKNATYLSQDREAIQWWQTATRENQPYLAPNELVTPKIHPDYTGDWSDDLAVDVITCVRIAQTRGLETLVLDQSRPDTGLAVVKVIIPGLRHFWPRFGPGRLYDVPVRMGWVQKPLTESQLNPWHIFF